MCPEQYDVFYKSKRLAYIRLRYGRLTCEVPDFNGKTIYKKNFKREWKGHFCDEKERKKYLDIIKTKIISSIV